MVDAMLIMLFLLSLENRRQVLLWSSRENLSKFSVSFHYISQNANVSLVSKQQNKIKWLFFVAKISDIELELLELCENAVGIRFSEQGCRNCRKGF